MNTNTQQEAEISKVRLHYQDGNEELRAKNEELREIISSYEGLVEKMSREKPRVDYKGRYRHVASRLRRYRKIFGRLYWYK